MHNLNQTFISKIPRFKNIFRTFATKYGFKYIVKSILIEQQDFVALNILPISTFIHLKSQKNEVFATWICWFFETLKTAKPFSRYLLGN